MAPLLHHGADLAAAQVACIVVHGRGQTQADMMEAIVSRLDLPGVAFVLPKSDGPAWYDARAVDPLTPATCSQLARGFTMLDAVLAGTHATRPDIPVLLAGFSQGACLAAEYLLARGPVVCAAALLTGCRVGVAADARPLTDLAGLPLYVTGGDADPWIPAAAFHELLSELTAAGARVRSDLFPGRPHEVSAPEIATLSAMLAALAAGQPLLEAA
jgi:phospholipase/carboxylesterase